MTALEAVRRALADILEETEGRVDVEDRADGGVRPNPWMRIARRAQDGLDALADVGRRC